MPEHYDNSEPDRPINHPSDYQYVRTGSYAGYGVRRLDFHRKFEAPHLFPGNNPDNPDNPDDY